MDDKTISIKAVAVRRSELEAESTRILEELAQKLVDAIPSGLQQWAREHDFIQPRAGTDIVWKFPKRLDDIIRCGATGYFDKYMDSELIVYGFTGLNDIKRKFKALETAWDGLIEIKVNGGNAGRVTIHFRATEFVPEKTHKEVRRKQV